MKYPPAKIVAELLRDGSNAPFVAIEDSSSTWPLFISSLPDGNGVPDNGACVFDTPGTIPARFLGTGQYLFNYGIQIMVRASTYLEGWEKVQEVETLLAGIHSEEIVVEDKTYFIDTFQQTSPIIPLGSEPTSKRREMFTINYLVSIKEL